MISVSSNTVCYFMLIIIFIYLELFLFTYRYWVNLPNSTPGLCVIISDLPVMSQLRILMELSNALTVSSCTRTGIQFLASHLELFFTIRLTDT